MRTRTLGVFAASALLIGLVAMSLAPASAAASAATPSAVHIGFDTFEPTIGATANGDLYFATTPGRGVAVGWSASIAKSTDSGRTWKDVGPTLLTRTNPPETNDPYIYVDPGTGRVFTFHMSPILTCSIMSFSDDGGKTWTTNPRGCSPTVIWDHQTMVAAKPRGLSTLGYPNILHQCVNAVYAAMCSRSLDGGLTWGESEPAYVNEKVSLNCGAQHGHLTAGPDGTIYLPTSRCGTNPMVYVSEDDGVTWRKSNISKMDTPFVDPSVSVDSKGTLYAAFIDEDGWLYYSISRNKGDKWSKPVRIAQGYTTNMPVIVAGDPGKVAITYPATNDLPKGYATKGYLDGNPSELAKKVSWGANVTVTYNGLTERPDFKTTVATGNDPLGRGRMCVNGTRCNYLIDFIEAVIGPDGRLYASFADGCLDECAKSADGPHVTDRGMGLLVTQQTGPPLCSRICWRYKGAVDAQAELLRSLGLAQIEADPGASLEHAVLSRDERILIRKATQSRLRAVGE